MKLKLFEIVVLYHKPIKEEGKVTDVQTEILSENRFLASDKESAKMKAIRSLSDYHFNNLEDIEVLVRPF